MGTGFWVRLMRISGTCLFDSSKNTEEGKRIKKDRMVMMKKDKSVTTMSDDYGFV